MILYGKPVCDALLDETSNIVKDNDLKLKLVIIANPNDYASTIYVNNKQKKCIQCGIQCDIINYGEDKKTQEYINLINQLNNDESVTGIIVQLPLPNGIDENKIIPLINPLKDVDGFTIFSKYAPCTPSGIISLIEYYKGKEWLKGKNAVVIGRSKIVGKPMADLLLNKDATVTICHSKTQNLKQHTINADLIVCAVGKANTITKDMVKENTMLIDVGINRDNEKLCGDCDFENLVNFCDITPVPGGVGPLTVATLVNRLPKLYYDKLNN